MKYTNLRSLVSITSMYTLVAPKNPFALRDEIYPFGALALFWEAFAVDFQGWFVYLIWNWVAELLNPAALAQKTSRGFNTYAFANLCREQKKYIYIYILGPCGPLQQKEGCIKFWDNSQGEAIKIMGIKGYSQDIRPYMQRLFTIRSLDNPLHPLKLTVRTCQKAIPKGK